MQVLPTASPDWYAPSSATPVERLSGFRVIELSSEHVYHTPQAQSRALVRLAGRGPIKSRSHCMRSTRERGRLPLSAMQPSGKWRFLSYIPALLAIRALICVLETYPDIFFDHTHYHQATRPLLSWPQQLHPPRRLLRHLVRDRRLLRHRGPVSAPSAKWELCSDGTRQALV